MKLGPQTLWGAALAGVAVPAGVALGAGAGLWGPAAVFASCGLATAGLGGLVGLGSALPSWQLFGEMRTSVPEGLVLTFDDGPVAGSTPRLLDLLDAHGHKSTCFLLADRVRAEPGLARRIVERGHEVGVHGLTHSAALTWMPTGQGARWLGEARDVLEQATGTRSRWFRPPFGVTSPRVFASARAAGLELAWCSVRTGDGGRVSPEELVRRCATAESGDVVLLHDGPATTLDVLPRVLSTWYQRGLVTRTLSDAVGR